MRVEIPYLDLVKRKIQRRFDEIAEVYVQGKGGKKSPIPRDRYSVQKTGLQYGYLQSALEGKEIQTTSLRVLNNLGFEIWLKDIETGEMEKVPFQGRCEIDHSDPSDPKLRE